MQKCAYMIHFNLIMCTVILRGESQRTNNYKSQRNWSLAGDRLLCDGRVISLVWFPEMFSWCCATVFRCFFVVVVVVVVLGGGGCTLSFACVVVLQSIGAMSPKSHQSRLFQWTRGPSEAQTSKEKTADDDLDRCSDNKSQKESPL